MSKLNPNVSEFIPASSQVFGNNSYFAPVCGYFVGSPNPGFRFYELHRGIDSIPLIMMSNHEVTTKTNKKTGKESTVRFTRFTFQQINFEPAFLPLTDQEALSGQSAHALQIGKLNVYSIDVECVASGKRHCDREVARIAIVNSMCEVIYSSFVKPSVPIVSYLTPLTGIQKADLENAPSLESCKAAIKRILPSDCILVGQGIGHDINWMGFQKGVDFARAVDIQHWFKYEAEESSPARQNRKEAKKAVVKSLRHEVLYLTGVDIQSGAHNPEIDAVYSMKLWLLFRNCTDEDLRKVKKYLHFQPATPSIRKLYPVIDGVMLTSPETCENCRYKDYVDVAEAH